MRKWDAVGFQDMMMPVVHPAELWQATNRWYDVGDALLRFKDRSAHDMVLAMTHEEVVVDLLKPGNQFIPAAPCSRIPHPDEVPR